MNASLKKSLFLMFLTIATVTLLVSGCGSAGVNSSDNINEKVTIAYGRDFYSGPEDISFLHMSTNVWESLTALDDKLVIKPVLLDKWESHEDGRVWDFYLKEGVKFHDETMLDADTLIYNIDHHLRTNHETQALYANVDSAEKLNENTVRLTLVNADPLFPNAISSFNSPIFSVASFNDDGTIKFPYGTGPYKLADYKAGDFITVERFDDYWGEKGKVKTFTFKTISDENTRIAALQSGEVDVIADVGAILPEQAAALEAIEGVKVYTQAVATTHYMFFNVAKPPFDNPQLRQALNMALNRQLLTDSVVYGFGIPGTSVITPLVEKWCNPDAAPVYNLDAAKEIVDQNPTDEAADIVINASFASRWPYKAMGEIILSALNDLGLDGQIKMYEGGAWGKEMAAGNYNISLHPYTLQTGEPDFYFSEWLHSTGELNKSRSLGVADPEVDALIERARETGDESEKIDLYNQLQLKAADEALMVPLYHEVAIYAARDYIADFTIDPQFKPDLARVQVK